MTKEERENVSNRLVLNFGILLLGALIMLYIYNFLNAGYTKQTATVVGVVGIISIIAAIVMFVVGKIKKHKILNYSAIPFGMFIAALITYFPRFNLISGFTMKNAVILVFILMLAYFIVLTIINAIILKTHPEAPVEKKIKHAKGKKKRKK